MKNAKNLSRCGLLILCVCMLLAACTKSDAGTLSPSSSQTTTATSKHAESNVGDAVLPDVEIPLLTITSYSEYTSFIETANTPDIFVQYNSIKQFGSFVRFVCMSDSRYGDYSHYLYTLNDKTGSEILLYVEQNRQISTKLPQPSRVYDVNTANMRLLSTNQSGYYLHNNLTYTYISGQLLSISWENNGTIFTIAGDSVSSYPEDESSTMLGKLLNLQSAEYVVNSISVPSQTN